MGKSQAFSMPAGIKPADIVRQFHEGCSIESITRHVHYLRIFKTKALACDYVRRCIYEDARAKRRIVPVDPKEKQIITLNKNLA